MPIIYSELDARRASLYIREILPTAEVFQPCGNKRLKQRRIYFAPWVGHVNNIICVMVKGGAKR